MKYFLVTVSLSVGLSLLSPLGTYAFQIDERVKLLRDSGSPALLTSSKCPRKGWREDLSQRLGYGADHLCVKLVRLPKAALDEIMTMAEEQLINRSDFDTRATKLYLFEQEAFGPSLDMSNVHRLANVLRIPLDQVNRVRFSSELGSTESFQELNGVNIGDELVEQTYSHSWISEKMQGKLMIKAEFGARQGEFNVTYRIYLAEGYMVYTKTAWWN